MCSNVLLSDNQCWNYNLQKKLVQYIHFWSSYDKFCVIFECQFWPKILSKNDNFWQILIIPGLIHWYWMTGFSIYNIFDLLWRNREQVPRQMFLLLALQYCMTNIGPTLCIQPDNTQFFMQCDHAVTPYYNGQGKLLYIEWGNTASR